MMMMMMARVAEVGRALRRCALEGKKKAKKVIDIV